MTTENEDGLEFPSTNVFGLIVNDNVVLKNWEKDRLIAHLEELQEGGEQYTKTKAVAKIFNQRTNQEVYQTMIPW